MWESVLISIVLHKYNVLLFCSVSVVYFRMDTTRIEYSIPLRENWALPYFACQIAALTGYLKSNLNTYGEVRENFVVLVISWDLFLLIIQIILGGKIQIYFSQF